MTWYHYTYNPNLHIKNTNETDEIKHNPRGIWLSGNEEWLNWSYFQKFYTFDAYNYYIYTYSVDKLKIYKVSSIEYLYELNKKT